MESYGTAPMTHEELLRIIDYNSFTGTFVSKVRRGKILAGTVLGYAQINGRSSRLKFAINGTTYMAHRLAWFYVYGKWPVEEIDHINGDSSDNRICNLREADHQQNMSNISKPKTNKSGRIGVSWHAGGRKWQAHIKVNGVNKYLGLFDAVEEAHAAYLGQAQLLRGEFARTE
jgi:hypothetical protein